MSSGREELALVLKGGKREEGGGNRSIGRGSSRICCFLDTFVPELISPSEGKSGCEERERGGGLTRSGARESKGLAGGAGWCRRRGEYPAKESGFRRVRGWWKEEDAGGLRASLFLYREGRVTRCFVACRWEGRGGRGVDVRRSAEEALAKSPLSARRERESSAEPATFAWQQSAYSHPFLDFKAMSCQF